MSDSRDLGMGTPTHEEWAEMRAEMAARSPEMRAYQAHQDAAVVINGVAIGLQLTVQGPHVDTVDRTRDRSLPEGVHRLTVSDHELLIDSMEWEGRQEELRERVRAWLLEHVTLRGTRLVTGRRRTDPWWSARWREANPW
ncbi:hypothetical protein [Brachybacterium hainanense]|uniref:Uncharacterized protein n=1 Tax=Brachybacterium hainanense TaxID=1541174 RepID=A0ABV6RB19_9MICO